MSGNLSLKELCTQLSTGQLTPSAAVERSLVRISTAEPQVKAWVNVDAEGARKQAQALERQAGRKGPLWGVPVAIKDLIDVAGLPTGCGSRLAGTSPVEDDADCVRKLRDAGGVVLGKTVTTEFGYFAPGPTRNPVNPLHTPGGSSSGSAAAVAAGMVPLAFGTQTAGSLTRPASFCGIAGFVAAPRQFSTVGITGLSPSFDSLGLLARTVEDLRFAWMAMCGSTESTQWAKEDTSTAFDRRNSGSVGFPRVLLWDGSGLGGELSSDMVHALKSTALSLRVRGVPVANWNEHSLVHQLASHHVTVMAYEASRERRRELRLRDQLSTPFADLLTTGAAISDSGYAAALEAITSARHHVLDLFSSYDVILGPAALGSAPIGLEATGTPVLSRPWQALGLPVVTIPGHHDEAGMPLGLQLIGVPRREQELFTIAGQIERLIAELVHRKEQV